ncbi:MAG: hypothetical protein HY646_12870 [Acidobacteria bacterium]|nr:hypothetical protein [Acidobacteriota bacterium]
MKRRIESIPPCLRPALILSLAALACLPIWAQLRNAPAPQPEYGGSEACGKCHRAYYESYRKTSMGRSMILASDPEHARNVPADFAAVNPSSKRSYRVFREGSDLYQSQYTIDPLGRIAGERRFKIEYVMGSGTHGFGYLVKQGDYLVEAPLSYYTGVKMWDFSPGYRTSDFGFERRVLPRCLECHSGRPQPDASEAGKYRNPPFRELAIGCENCHGPGKRHVDLMSSGGRDTPTTVSIVNPGKTPGRAVDGICMKCHEDPAAAGVNPLAIRPTSPPPRGPLPQPLGRGTPVGQPQTDLLSHYSSMAASGCFRGTNGRFGCTTCHDPHSKPDPGVSAAYYRTKCLSCHTGGACPLPLAQRNRTIPANNCTECHMPKRAVGNVPHTALTNHRIPARTPVGVR